VAQKNLMASDKHPRSIRSYVIRQGRMTSAQSRALNELMPCYGLDTSQLNDPDLAFGQRAPLALEIGIGNGDNLLAMATRSPATHYLGCEVHRPGLGHALLGLGAGQLTNVRLLDADAHDVLRALPRASLDCVYMFFPDPWPKKRHHKRRLLNAELLELLAEKLKPSASFHFASDDHDYALAVLETCSASRRWRNLAGVQSWAPRLKRRVITRFEKRALTAQRPIFELALALT
jgi:tRNA (guanine-N7-)-methyltransferase